MRRLFSKIKKHKSTLAVPMGQGLTAGAGLVAYMLLTRALGPDRFGEYIILIAGTTFFDMLRRGLVRQGFVKDYVLATNNEQKRLLKSAAWQLYVGFSVLAAALVWAWGWVLPSLVPSSFAVFVAWFPWVFLVMAAAQMAVFEAQARKKYIQVAAFTAWQPVLFLALLAWGFVIQGAIFTKNDVAMLFVVSHGVASVGAVVLGWAQPWLLWGGAGEQRRRLLAFGKYSTATLLGTNLLKSADVFMIGAWLGPAPAGLYAVGQKILEVAEMPLRSASVVLYPKLVQAAKQPVYFKKLLGQAGLGLTLLIVPIVAVGVVAPQWSIGLLAGSEFLAAAGVFVVMATYTLLLPTDRVLGLAFDAANQPRINTQKTLLMAAINIIGNGLAIWLTGQLWVVALVTIATGLVGVGFGLLRLPVVAPFQRLVYVKKQLSFLLK